MNKKLTVRNIFGEIVSCVLSDKEGKLTVSNLLKKRICVI